MDGRGRWVTSARAAIVTAPFLALAALPGLARVAPRPLAAGSGLAAEQPVPQSSPALTLVRRWPREHRITQGHPLTLYWGCRDGAGGCRFTSGKLVAESMSTLPLDLRADHLGLDTFSVSAPAGHVLHVLVADGADCRTVAGDPHQVQCTLTGPSAVLTFATAP
jgi:hypothetical protein